MLPASQLKQIADRHLQFGKTLGIEYPGDGRAAIAAYYDETHYELAFLDPFTGEVKKYKDMTKDFFRIVLDGHYYLWLPHHIGQPIAASATLVFLIMMITGIILWWPRNKAAQKQRFSIRWHARWRRKNYDLHNVLGFYMTWVAIFLAITGLVFGFQWFARSIYWVTSGGVPMEEHRHPVSDTSHNRGFRPVADQLLLQHRDAAGIDESVAVYFANTATDPVEIVVNHRPGTYYKSDFYHYDQYSGRELPATGTYAGKFRDAKLADKIARMNYDMHVGAVLGIPGKLLAFFASLIAASLPVTGFLIWRGRKRKQKKTSLQAVARQEISI
jgi:uncharacterized iron-regulated membrane protein